MQGLFARQKADRVEEGELVSLVGGRRDTTLEAHGSSTAQLTLSVKGMHCSACSTAVENALK